MEDPYLWLENVTGEKQLTWVRQQNEITVKELESNPRFQPTRTRLLTILNSRRTHSRRVKRGGYYYNFWMDEKNPRGIWRRTTLEEYRKPEPDWEIVLDVDQLATSENENWIWKSAEYLEPTFDRAMVGLSRGGADATVQREFDLIKKEFVSDGFVLPEAKTYLAWRNRDALYVGSDFGPGSLTKSGYPRLVKEWTRATPLAEARVISEAKEEDMLIHAEVVHDHGRVFEFIVRRPTFFH